jgi:hypothetical protein
MGGKENRAIVGPEGGDTRKVDGTDNILGIAPPPNAGSMDGVICVVVVAEGIVNPRDAVGCWD